MNKELRNQLISWLERFRWDFFITLNPNRPTLNLRQVNPTFLAERRWELDCWHKFSDRDLLGKRWKKNPNRTFFLAFPEIGSKSELLHWHLLVIAASSHKNRGQVYRNTWRKICPGGDACILPANLKAVSYSLKSTWSDFTVENYVISEISALSETRRVGEMCFVETDWDRRQYRYFSMPRKENEMIGWDKARPQQIKVRPVVPKAPEWDKIFDETKEEVLGSDIRQVFSSIRNQYQANGYMTEGQAYAVLFSWNSFVEKEIANTGVARDSFRSYPETVYELENLE